MQPFSPTHRKEPRTPRNSAWNLIRVRSAVLPARPQRPTNFCDHWCSRGTRGKASLWSAAPATRAMRHERNLSYGSGRVGGQLCGCTCRRFGSAIIRSIWSPWPAGTTAQAWSSPTPWTMRRKMCAAPASSRSWPHWLTLAWAPPNSTSATAGCRGGPGWPGAAAARGAAGPPPGDPRLREQVRVQQLGQDRGVDLVVLQPRRGDGLAPQRVHQMRLEAVVLQQLSQPAPAEGGLERHRRASREIADQPQERLRPVDHVLVQLHRPVLGDHCHVERLRCRSMPT